MRLNILFFNRHYQRSSSDMGATKSFTEALKRIGLMSGVALIAISASAIDSGTASAAAPATNQQVAEGQQQQNPPPQWQQHRQGNNQQNGQGQNRQWTQQNGQEQNWQQWNQQNGQPRYQQEGQGQNRQQWSGQGGQPQWQQNSERHRYNWAAYQPGRRPPQWQQYRQDFDPRPYEWNRASERHYYWDPYSEPRGWYYQRWAYGEVLPIIFWGREYWLPNYSQFGLIDPPYGYVWVRYGNDALLVDVESGQILSVEYGLFYS
jgi:nickel/cobalt transporter regulator